jgi:hypothetical protein
MARARSVLHLLFWTAVAVSIVHYVDNYTAFADYPQTDSALAPTKTAIGVSWFVFTALGVAGYALFLRERLRPAGILLALYSISGLIGIGHYTVAGATDMPWWRQAHIAADIACGIAILAFAVWTARQVSGSPGRAPASGARP